MMEEKFLSDVSEEGMTIM